MDMHAYVYSSQISSQLRTLRQELENQMDGRMKKLEDGQIDLGRQVAALGRQVARLEGLFDGLRRPLPEESRAA